MSKKLYVGNLSFDTTEDEVRSLFTEFGAIESLAMINDRDTGRFRGFCFIELEPASALAAINTLNGKDFKGRNLTVNEAKPRAERGGGNRNSRYPDSGGRRRY